MRWTRIYMSGLRMGLTTSDLRTMPIGRLMWMAKSLCEEPAAEQAARGGADDVREATQGDIFNLLCC